MIIGILGILKAGGAYVPIDPNILLTNQLYAGRYWRCVNAFKQAKQVEISGDRQKLKYWNWMMNYHPQESSH
jgi:non-ribosomal peptide synthetase component F